MRRLALGPPSGLLIGRHHWPAGIRCRCVHRSGCWCLAKGQFARAGFGGSTHRLRSICRRGTRGSRTLAARVAAAPTPAPAAASPAATFSSLAPILGRPRRAIAWGSFLTCGRFGPRMAGGSRHSGRLPTTFAAAARVTGPLLAPAFVTPGIPIRVTGPVPAAVAAPV